jgi:hypothetical protein
LTVIMHNANDCINKIATNLYKLGFGINKVFERKRKILEAEVTQVQMNEGQIDSLV